MRPAPLVVPARLGRATWALPCSWLCAAAVGCGPPAPVTAPPAGPEPVKPPSTAHADAEAAATATSAPTDLSEVADDPLDGWADDPEAGTIDRPAPAAPCDLARPYRGTIGTARISMMLSRAGSVLKGHAAYDTGFGELDLGGRVEPDGTFTLTESSQGKKVGTLSGACEPDTGILRGTWSGGGKDLPVALAPRGAHAVALKERHETLGRPMPDDQPSCTWSVRSPQVLGLGDPGRTARINAALLVRIYSEAERAEVQRAIAQCPAGTSYNVSGWYSVEHDTDGLLSVLHTGYVYASPAVHGWWNAGADAISIDVPTGRRLTLTDIVTSSRALRPVVGSCMELTHESLDPSRGGSPDWWEQAIQGLPRDRQGEPAAEGSPDFDPESIFAPSFLVLGDGIAVLIRNQPTVSAALELRGPVIRWGALLRAGLLKKGSPIARLWKSAPPLASDEPACVRFFEPRWARRAPPSEARTPP